MHRLPLVGLSLLAVGCFHTTHRPSCEEVSRTEVAMDEVTAAGTADDLLAFVGMDATLPGTYTADGSPVDVDLLVEADGPAAWVEQQETTIKTRSFGIGSSRLMMAAYCPAQLELPLYGEARTPDGAVEVTTQGMAFLADAAEQWDEGVPFVLLDEGSYADATLPPTEEDPSDYHDKYAYIQLTYDQEGLVDGAAGWGGYQETEEYSSSVGEAAVRFAPMSEGDDPAER